MEWKKVGGGHLPWQCWAGGFSHLVMVWPWPVCGALMYLQSVLLFPLPPPKHGARAARSPSGSLYYSLIGMTGGEHSNPGGHRSGHSSLSPSFSLFLSFFFFLLWKDGDLILQEHKHRTEASPPNSHVSSVGHAQIYLRMVHEFELHLDNIHKTQYYWHYPKTWGKFK